MKVENNEIRSNINIKTINTKLREVNQFLYFGSTITEDNFYAVEIKRVITLGKQVHSKNKTVMNNNQFSIEAKNIDLERDSVWIRKLDSS